ncbi:hypothetical protein D3C77_274380 [compost metagenome]
MPHGHALAGGRNDRAASQEEAGRHDIELQPLFATQAQRPGHVRRLHIAEGQGQPLEIVADRLDGHAVLVRDARPVRGVDRQDDVLLVQHLVVLEVVHQGHGRHLGIRGQEDGRARRSMRRTGAQHLDQVGQRQAVLARLVGQDLGAAHPGPHQHDQAAAQDQGHPGAVGNLQQVGGQEDRVDEAERHQRQQDGPHRPLPLVAHHGEGHQGVDHHGAGHRHPIGRRQIVRRLEGHQDEQHPHHQQAVDRGHIDLAGLGLGGVADVQARQQAELDRLLRDRESAGDHRLAGDHRGRRGQDQHRPIDQLRHHVPEGVVGGAGMSQQEGALAQVVQRQAGQDGEQPTLADRRLAEMTHVRIEGLGPRHGQEDAAQDDEAEEAVLEKQLNSIVRRQGAQDGDVVEDMHDAQQAQAQEPAQGDRAEKPRQPGRAPRLHHEQGDQYARRQGQDKGVQPAVQARRLLQALNGRQHGDGGGDDPVAVEQGRAAQPQDEQPGAAAADGVLGQGHQGQGAALALVVGPHQEHDVFERHHDHQGPEGQGHHADDGQVAADAFLSVGDGLAQGVDGAGADVAENHADGAQNEGAVSGLAAALALAVAMIAARAAGGRRNLGVCGFGSCSGRRGSAPAGRIPDHAIPPVARRRAHQERRGFSPFPSAVQSRAGSGRAAEDRMRRSSLA